MRDLQDLKIPHPPLRGTLFRRDLANKDSNLI